MFPCNTLRAFVNLKVKTNCQSVQTRHGQIALNVATVQCSPVKLGAAIYVDVLWPVKTKANIGGGIQVKPIFSSVAARMSSSTSGGRSRLLSFHSELRARWLAKRCLPKYLCSSVLKQNAIITATNHEEGVADPQATPACGTLRDRDVLAVDGNGDRRSFAHGAAADVRFDVTLLHGHHGKRSRGGQPVGFVVSAGVVAKVARVAVQEGHGTEPWETGASQT